MWKEKKQKKKEDQGSSRAIVWALAFFNAYCQVSTTEIKAQ